MPPFYFQDFESSLLSLLLILFQVNCLFHLHLFSLVGFYHVALSAGCFSLFPFCLVYCVWGLLSTGWKVVISLNCGVSLPLVRLNQYLMKVSWMGGFVPLLWWMELNLVSLEGSALSNSVFLDVCGFSMALGTLSANVKSCAPILLKDWHGAFSTGAYWLLDEIWS